jgi:hypothetical protein
LPKRRPGKMAMPAAIVPGTQVKAGEREW